jgi:hypothetical protein
MNSILMTAGFEPAARLTRGGELGTNLQQQTTEQRDPWITGESRLGQAHGEIYQNKDFGRDPYKKTEQRVKEPDRKSLSILSA